MAEQKTLKDLEREAAHSWREWPVYIVMRLKRLQAIQAKLRVEGQTPSALLRKEQLLAAVHDDIAEPAAGGHQKDEADVEYDVDDPVARAESANAATDDDDYSDDIDYDAT